MRVCIQISQYHWHFTHCQSIVHVYLWELYKEGEEFERHILFFFSNLFFVCKGLVTLQMPVNGPPPLPLAKVQYMCDENINTPRGQRMLMKYCLAFTQYPNGGSDTPICFALLRILNCTRGNDFLTRSLCRLTNEMLSWLWAIYICDYNYSLAFSFLLELPSRCYLRSLPLCAIRLVKTPFCSFSLFLISVLS